ncbi:MAG: hypothetical protein U0670_10245 [Anaerolineae bacterium]
MIALFTGSLLFTSSSVILTDAQQDKGTYHIAVQITETFALYAVDEMGITTLIRDFGSQFGMVRTERVVEWFILTQDDIVPSPDGRFIAFVGLARQPSTDTALFVYDIAQDSLQQISLTGVAVSLWSPDSSSIALIADSHLIDFQPIMPLSIYDIASGALLSVTGAEGAGVPYVWTGDSQFLLYTDRGQPCPAASCIDAFADWYRVNRIGQNRQQITTLSTDLVGTSAPPSSTCAPAQGIWSDVNNRLYYSVGCINAQTGNDQSFILSTSLEGGTRTEIDDLALYPSDRHSYIRGLAANNDGVMVVIAADVDTGVLNTSGIEWRVLHISTEQSLTTLYQERFPIDVSRIIVDFSVFPDGNSMVVVGVDVIMDRTHTIALWWMPEALNWYNAMRLTELYAQPLGEMSSFLSLEHN